MNQPSYYSVIPASVRYNKNLTYFEIVLYGEISALTLKNGYCFASNEYLATLFGKTERTISSAINNLVKFGHLWSLIDKEQGNTRRLYLHFLDYQESQQNGGGIEKNFHRGIEKNFHSITFKKSKVEDREIARTKTSAYHSTNINQQPIDKELQAIVSRVYSKKG